MIDCAFVLVLSMYFLIPPRARWHYAALECLSWGTAVWKWQG